MTQPPHRRAHPPRRPPTTASSATIPYDWLRDPGYPKVEDPAVLAHLAAENACVRRVARAARRPRRDAVRRTEGPGEGRRRRGAGPRRRVDYWWRFEPGGQYRVWLRRRPAAPGGDDGGDPVRAASRRRARTISASPGSACRPTARRAAWTADDDGSERFKLFVRDLATGADTLVATTAIGVAVWAADSASLAWTEVNDAWRPYRVRLHRLGRRQRRRGALRGGRRELLRRARPLDRPQPLPGHRRRPCHERGPADPDRRSGSRRRSSSARGTTGVEYDVDVRGDTLFVRTNDTPRQLPPRHRAARAPGRLDRPRRRRRPRLPARADGVRVVPRGQRAGRRARRRPADLPRRDRPPHRLPRGELHRRYRQQPRARRAAAPPRLQLDGHAGDDVRLRRRRRPPDRPQGPGGAERLRREPATAPNA